jgi:sugar/nucleoside kinase (ribokinase family)
MQTYLGACVDLGPNDVDADLIRSAEVVYLEGYLWDPPHAKEAFIKAAKIAHEAGRKVSLTLSDAFCVDRHRDSFIDLVNSHVDILFANENEITSLYQVDEFDDALQHVRGHCSIAALTRSEKGSVVLADGEIHVVDAAPVAKVVDTTGAGDAYAGGFLYGFTHGRSFHDCARLGGVAAAEIISHFGARPETPLSELAKGI